MSSIIILGKSPAREYRWILRAGQHARLGRSPWAEFCIEDDAQLLDFHCHLRHELDETVTVTACDSAHIECDHLWQTTTRDHEQLQVFVGETCLRLTRQRRHVGPSHSAHWGDSPIDAMPVTNELRLPTQLLQEIGLSTHALALLDPRKPAQQSLGVLVESELIEDAVRYLTAVLELPARHRWCYVQLSQAGLRLDDGVDSLAQRWLDNPNESLRQAIVTHIDWNQKQDPCTWLLAAIGWTGGSLSGATSICVPPTDTLVITAVITAMNLAAAQRETDVFRMQAIEQGMQLLIDPVSLTE